ncbi:GlsB/YeaQ/YmgE family stress response membrane protein [Marinilactibacillus sp. GCM10026970]|uniref:GlsB/YeaQ/YmgE family stress response membrane protein n=1 Tax=Marinilactibacillus sp. GCM10026970 TaxID=3252642 RepID=UPI003614C683
MLGFILMLIIGGIVGAIGQAIIGKNVPGGIIGNIVVGLLGSALGGYLLADIGPTIEGIAIFPAIVGAVIVVFLFSLLAKK